MKSEIDIISEILNNSPSVELLRLRNRELVIRFLYDTFYHQRRPVSYENLSVRLTDFLSYINLENDDETGITAFDSFDEKARKYIQRWTDKGFLCNYQEENGEVFYELSSYSSKTIDWLVSLKREDFVGTESKFMNLFGQMKELVEFTNDDREERIRLLEEKRKEIEHQIQTIRAGGDAKVFEEYQILPRFHQITQSAKELLSDFKEVEDNFKSITKIIYQKHAEGEVNKGDILGFTFDALDKLQKSPQGKSFYAFWDFLLTPKLQNTWDNLVSQLYDTLDERNMPAKDAFLKNMKQYLYNSGKKVYQANDKMAEKLSRIICEKSIPKETTVQRIIQEIQSSLLDMSQKGMKPDISLEIETTPDIVMYTERKLTLEKRNEVTYRQALELAATDISQATNAEKLFERHGVDREVIKQRINTALKKRKQVSLKDIIEKTGGLTKGLAELFGYISVLRDYRHTIDEERTVAIEFNGTECKSIVVPEIIVIR